MPLTKTQTYDLAWCVHRGMELARCCPWGRIRSLGWAIDKRPEWWVEWPREK